MPSTGRDTNGEVKFTVYAMTYADLLILSLLNCGLLCKGQVIPPSNKNVIVLPGSTARLNWIFAGDISRAVLFWYFARKGGSEEEIAIKYPNQPVEISNSSLPGVAIESPLALVLKNVDESYSLKYRLNIAVAGGGDADVELLVADKPTNTKIRVPKEAYISEKLVITCDSDGLPAPTFTITNNVTTRIVSNKATYAKNATVKYSDGGMYTCIAKNILGNDTDSGNLIIKGKVGIFFFVIFSRRQCTMPPLT